MFEKKWLLVGIGAVALLTTSFLLASPRGEFYLGGGLVNVGMRLQDRLHPYDFEHNEITPEQVWSELERQNESSASMRSHFPRSTEHPVVAMLVCMDARIDTSELVGDTRRYYYVIRTAGSVLDVQEEEMLELAVQNGVKVIILTRHSDCAAEKAAADPDKRRQYPVLTTATLERDQRIAEFLARPLIADRIAKGELLVKQMFIDTSTDHLVSSMPATFTSTPTPSHH